MKCKILFYDLETAPNIGYIWEKYEQNVLAFIKEREILSCAYKWQGDKTISCITREGEKDDKHLVKRIHKLFEEADIVVAHNGDRFDQGIAKARMIYHGMLPPRLLQSIDTRKVAKNYFKFNGNGLEDLGQYFQLGKKIRHSGFDMWLGCLSGKRSSWKEMVKYNKQDVILLEKIYDRLKPWIHNHPTIAGVRGKCPHNADHRVKRRGVHRNRVSVRRQWSCSDCGAWWLGEIVKPE